VKDLAAIDRPREKLVRAGAAALGDNELVALVIGAGTRGRNALSIAQEVLAAVGGADGLIGVDVEALRLVPGVGLANAARLVAAVELGRRAIVRSAGERPRFGSVDEMARYLMLLYGGFRVERFGVALFDVKHRLIKTSIISVGELDASVASPREIFRDALVTSAFGVALFHNHPSGDPSPSPADLMVTSKLKDAGDMLGVRVMDHIILGRDSYFSFVKAGRL
jgi:DNA repair protein RadC